MKSSDDVVRAISKRLDQTWHTSLLAELGVSGVSRPPALELNGSGRAEQPLSEAPVLWPKGFALGRTSSAQIAADFGVHVRQLQQWRQWAAERRVDLVEEPRSISGTPQQVAVRVVVPDVDTAAAIVGDEWPRRLAARRLRAAALLHGFPMLAVDPALPRTLRAVAGLSDLDFDILCRVAQWFGSNPPETTRRLTPRQVPLPGVHAKWLNKHQNLVRVLAGLDDLGLLPSHPSRVHFSYLDPDYLGTGRRRHDSYSIGDAIDLPYQPTAVLISENKDTAVGFPPTPGAIAVEGAGAGGGTIASVPWVQAAPLVVYWGDMDADGLRILNEFRQAGVPALSMLMDVPTYNTYVAFGTNYAPNGQALKVPPLSASLPYLHEDERALYDLLASGSAPSLRVEQEQIPLTVAARRLLSLRQEHAQAQELTE